MPSNGSREDGNSDSRITESRSGGGWMMSSGSNNESQVAQVPLHEFRNNKSSRTTMTPSGSSFLQTISRLMCEIQSNVTES